MRFVAASSVSTANNYTGTVHLGIFELTSGNWLWYTNDVIEAAYRSYMMYDEEYDWLYIAYSDTRVSSYTLHKYLASTGEKLWETNYTLTFGNWTGSSLYTISNSVFASYWLDKTNQLT